MSVCSALLIVKVIFVTTLFFKCFSTFLVNKDDQIDRGHPEFGQQNCTPFLWIKEVGSIYRNFEE